MQQIEELDHRRHRDAPVVTTLRFYVFEYIEQYLVCFDVGRFHRMWTDGNKLRVQELLGKCSETDFAGWFECWNHWGSRSTLSCPYVGKETDSLFLRC